MGSRFDPQYDGPALAKCEALGLHPKSHPMGDDHHTDVTPSPNDQAIGEALAYFLGGIFTDHQCDPDQPHRQSYYYRGMTSIDVWTRVARALRIHGLTISDATKSDDGTQPARSDALS